MKKRNTPRTICYNCSHAYIVDRRPDPLICQCLISDDGFGNYERQVARYHSCSEAEPSKKPIVLHKSFINKTDGKEEKRQA